MTAFAAPAKYEQFRVDVYLVKSHNDWRSNPVIANFASPELANSFAKWYVGMHAGQLAINDLKTDEIKYVGEFKQQPLPAWEPREPKVVEMPAPAKAKKHHEPVHAEEPESKPAVIVSHKTLSKKELAIALLKVIRDSKPLPARKIAEKAEVDYDIAVKHVLKELRDLNKIVFDNGRWRKP